MPNCKICGKPVVAANVIHSACWEHEANKVAEEFCDNYCRFPPGRPRMRKNCKRSTATAARW